ncbi:hypothetical protein JJB07_01480 [Tumebacillus sp. ITR2]|uniref:Restriction endonuclease type IV Mrr domain-containing protein n=1 Tax=Tumebacillus amylolyticus TaxID=2801339 RepID=A0ABS1J4U6_9BACL|nr:hypothetical protein [Tumebacillus amylolyticus]MBL0385304.1 hypothetical protein [Tumebacillus amylolyticus]
MSSSIVVGKKIQPDQLQGHAGFLVQHKYATVTERQFINCIDVKRFGLGESRKGCNTINYISAGTEVLSCRNCGEDLELFLDSPQSEFEITKINYRKIMQDCCDKIIASGVIREYNELGNGVYTLIGDDITGVLVFNCINLDIGVAIQQIMVGEKFFCVDIDGESTINTSVHYCKKYSVQECLEADDVTLRSDLKYLPNSSQVNALMEKRNQVRSSLTELAKKITWQTYEGPFTDFVISKIRGSHRKFVEFQYVVSNHPAYSTIQVQVGGAGRTDYRLIQMNSYLDILFDKSVIIDAKRYSTTEINNGVLEKIEHHIAHDPTDPRRALIITSTDHITCWDELINWYNMTGKYKIVVLTPQILAFILCFFELEEEILDYMRALVAP